MPPNNPPTQNTLLKELKTTFLLTLPALILLATFSAFLAMGHEAGTDKSPIGKAAYEITATIHFSLDFWNNLTPSLLALAFSFITSSLTLSLFIITTKKLFTLIFP